MHFLALGAALFAVYAWLPRGGKAEARAAQVKIGEGDVRWLKETWSRQWQREPTPTELKGLVTEYLREELLAREAIELGLDREDPYVRRRLAQKLEFVLRDTARLGEPSEDELQRAYAAHPELYRADARVTFTQVYFRREHEEAVQGALARLRDGADPAGLGDGGLLEGEFREATRADLVAQFGPAFGDAVLALAPGPWSGPIASTYGFHLVRVKEAKRAEPRPFADVRAQVLERWRDDRQKEGFERFFAGLREKYDVVVDPSVKDLVGPLTDTGGAR